ncbi:hypothetical protein TVAG_132910 [Trichomonas vaginalis G3]|uniref:Myb-like domain-containing protein n=1 Tax=Trichomonas vaginalis (strain ATCC PRA-98 / G3) TaxID=412133 RepID=A2G3I3_TRIV3|nr:U-box domain family [Trichomonas vaginalis G3]EAX88286.1 hypothetical protein TVAG_132910 [Trichomonas vaginalis G3]KAI5488699.1 U-box domain family [Trichomonas vaginalis G3]|eukprot:XP_001301216.1 hypothetical protein [Trichomonas vaginalis G3]
MRGLSGASESPSGKRPISFEDLKCLIKSPPDIDDPEVLSFILKNQENTIKRSLKLLNQNISVVYQNWPDASPVRIYIAYELCNNDIETLLLELSKPEFNRKVDETMKERLTGVHDTTSSEHQEEEDAEEEEEFQKGDNDYINHEPPPMYERKKRSHEKSTYSSDDDGQRIRRRRPKAETVPIDPSEPCPKGVSTEAWLHWSPAKRKSYIQGMKNPNAYFYRNVAPGEKYITGPFTPEEKKIFLKRVEEFKDKTTGTITGEWGLFSRALPGRVGYQCSNFYRKLINSGELYDPKYVRSDDGMIHHTSHLKSAHEKVQNTLEKPKKFSHHAKPIDDDCINSISFFSSTLLAEQQKHPSQYPSSTSRSESSDGLSLYERYAANNPIPNWTDPLTGEIMKAPAVSPDLTLLDYNTWLQTIKQTHEDPFTKKPITKRQITVLSKENWDEFKDRIIEKYAEQYAPSDFVNE